MLEYTSERRCFSYGFKRAKFIRFTEEERTEIVGQYLSGQGSYKSIAKDRGISWKIVESMVRKYRNTGTTISKQKVDLKKRFN